MILGLGCEAPDNPAEVDAADEKLGVKWDYSDLPDGIYFVIQSVTGTNTMLTIGELDTRIK
jgi:hypothetical protein